jgi:serine/threonine protein kinase
MTKKRRKRTLTALSWNLHTVIRQIKLPSYFSKKLRVIPSTKKNDVLYLEIESPITKSVGTRTFASPEQLQADKGNFDHRADVFSLGIVYLLLFHPMVTSMEQYHAIKDCKHGKVPQELQKDLPEISNMIIKMLSNQPSDRPSIEDISRYLNLPIQEYSDLSGSLCIKRENSGTWRNKYFKLIDRNLYIFTKEQDKKAEQVYDLNQWSVQFQEGAGERTQVSAEENEDASTESSPSDISCIAIENPLQLGCTFKAESPNQTLDLYQKFLHFGESF